MGHAMATNLAKAGHELTVWNRTPGKTVEGAQTAANPAEAAKRAEVVWISVSDTAAVEQVLFGSNGVESVLAAGMTVVDSSTISPSSERNFARGFCQRSRVHRRSGDWLEDRCCGRQAGVYRWR